MFAQPTLVVGPWIKGEAFAYSCSACGREFRLPEELTAKQAMAKLLSAFRDHVREVHGTAAENCDSPGGKTSHPASVGIGKRSQT